MKRVLLMAMAAVLLFAPAANAQKVNEEALRAKLTGDQSIVKGSNIFPGYGSNAGYQGGTRLQANGTYTAGYTITGTWNPNID